MEKVFVDQEKFKTFSKIQKSLLSLRAKASEEDLDNILQLIPESYLSQKEELIMVCQLFAMYARINSSMAGNVIKLFEKIMGPIKEHLQNEPIFWNIFGGLQYFKLWMYEEGLISIEQIIQEAKKTPSSPLIAEYFLPEIIENEPELFEEDIQTQFDFNLKYTKESIERHKELRKKYFKWVRDCGDFHDDSYSEIETDRLRLSIKRDDFDSFQIQLAQSNTSINSKIGESVIEYFFNVLPELKLSLIDYAIFFKATNIFKFLLMNGAQLSDNSISFAIKNNSYEIIHIIESSSSKIFKENAFYNTVVYWNKEVSEYILDNYSDFGYLFDKPMSDENEYNTFITLIDLCFYSFNFKFLKKFILPFLNKNPEIVKKSIYKIIFSTLDDCSCYFLREFFNYPNVNVNHCSKCTSRTFLTAACCRNNPRAVEFLLSQPKIDTNELSLGFFSPLFISCDCFANMKIIKLLCEREKPQNQSIFSIPILLILKGNNYALQYYISKFDCLSEAQKCLHMASSNDKCYWFTIKVFVKYLIKSNKSEEELISFCNKNEIFISKLKAIISEIKAKQ